MTIHLFSEPHEKLLEVIDDIRSRIIKGEIVNASIVAVDNEDAVLSYVSGEMDLPYTLVGALEVQKIDIMRLSIEGTIPQFEEE